VVPGAAAVVRITNPVSGLRRGQAGPGAKGPGLKNAFCFPNGRPRKGGINAEAVRTLLAPEADVPTTRRRH